jgi:hypothetical protein
MSANDQSGTATATGQVTMSSDRIIGILQQQPEPIASVKIITAQQSEVDPKTISDDALYNIIRQDDDLRDQVTQYLNKLGYNTNVIPANNRTINATPTSDPAGNSRLTPRAVSPAKNQGCQQIKTSSSALKFRLLKENLS